VIAVLAVFALRRTALLVASLLPRRRIEEVADPPSVTLLVAARNEEGIVHRLLASLDAVDYPTERLFTVVVDDGSEDETGIRVERWASARKRTRVVRLAKPVGKPEALNRGLAAAPGSEIVIVCDADLAPAPDFIKRLVEPFADATVGASAGLRRPANATRTAVSRYAAVESWVHQLITSAGKDRLNLNPPILGFGAYRGAALRALDPFRPEARAEDADSTVELTRAGWRTRFAPQAVADNLVVERWADYWRQHLRWASNLLDAAPARKGPVRAPLARRVELWLMAAGYLDRVALVGAVALGVVGGLPLWVAPAYLALTGASVLVALARGGAGREAPRFVLATLAFFALDVVASLAAIVSYPFRKNVGWLPRRGFSDESLTVAKQQSK
jgi:cellulose synthase/poly-beta-1,6-N-acetylglucosamine synthase-like glycosyltransferase